MTITKAAQEFRVRVHDFGTTTPTDLTVDFTWTALGNYPTYGGQLVKILEGQYITSPWVVSIIDASNIFIDNMADGGRMNLMGRLTEIQENRDSGGWVSVATGRLTRAEQARDLKSFTIQVSDERWIEQQATIFRTSETSQLYPLGLRGGWKGFLGSVRLGTSRVEESVGNLRKIRFNSRDGITNQVISWIEGDVIDNPIANRSDGSGNFTHLRLSLDEVDYEVVSFTRTEIADIEQYHSVAELFDNGAAVGIIECVIDITGTGLSAPASAFLGYKTYIWAPTAPPDDTLPLHVGMEEIDYPGLVIRTAPYGRLPNESCWDLVTEIYDEIGVRYDQAAFDDLQVSTFAKLDFRITDPVKDVRQWLDEHIYKPMMVAPFIDEQGRVSPRSVRTPTDVVIFGKTLYYDYSNTFVFDSGNMRTAPTWEFGNELVTVVRAEYRAFSSMMLGTGVNDDVKFADTNLTDFAADGMKPLANTPAEFESDNVADVGRHVQSFNVDGFWRSPLGFSLFGFTPQTRRAKLSEALEFLHENIFARFRDGSITGRFESLKFHPDGSSRTPIDDVFPGDYVVLDIGSFPNPAVPSLGARRVVQLLEKSVQADSIIWSYLDVGPDTQPLAAPTATVALTSGETRHSVDITIAGVPAGATATVYVGTESGTITELQLPGKANGVFQLGGLPSNTLIRVQAQSVQPTRIGSDLSTENSVTTAAITAPSSLTTTITGSTIQLGWTVGDASYPLVPQFKKNADSEWLFPQEFYLPPGSTYYLFQIEASTPYDFRVYHEDQWGGQSAKTQTLNISTSSESTLTAPRNLQFKQARAVAADSPDPTQIVGYGFELSWRNTELAAIVSFQVDDTSSAFGSIVQEGSFEAGQENGFIFFTSLDETTYFVRIRHERLSRAPSPYSSTISAQITQLIRVVTADEFPSGFAYGGEYDNTDYQLNVGHGGDPDTDRAYFAVAVNPALPTDYPSVTEADEFVARADMPEVRTVEDPDDPPNILNLTTGDVVLLTVRFWNSVSGFGQTTQHRYVSLAGQLLDLRNAFLRSFPFVDTVGGTTGIDEEVFPSSDVETSNWAVTPLWSKIDEDPPLNADWVTSDLSGFECPTTDTFDFEVHIGNPTGTPATESEEQSLRVRTRLRRGTANAGTADFVIELIQGTTVIDSFNHDDVGASFQSFTDTISNAAYDAITDHTDLRIRVTTTICSVLDANQITGECSWATLEYVAKTPQVGGVKIDLIYDIPSTVDELDFNVKWDDGGGLAGHQYTISVSGAGTTRIQGPSGDFFFREDWISFEVGVTPVTQPGDIVGRSVPLFIEDGSESGQGTRAELTAGGTAASDFVVPGTGLTIDLDGDGRVRFNATGSGATQLDDLSDVNITTPLEGQVLYRNATEFVNDGSLVMRDNGSVTNPTFAWLTDPDSGFYLPGVGQVNLAIAGALQVQYTASSVAYSNRTLHADGIRTLPGIAFGLDSTLGFWRPGSGIMGLSANEFRLQSLGGTGNPRLSFYQTTTSRSFIQHLDASDVFVIANPDGVVSLRPGTGGTETEVMVLVSGSHITALQEMRFPDGTAAAPAMNFFSEIGMGWYRRSANVVGLAGDADLLPENDSLSDLGSTSVRWANIWVDNVNGSPPGGASFPLLAPDGSLGAPSYSFTNDVDSGVTMAGGAGTLQLVVGAAARMSLTTSLATVSTAMDVTGGMLTRSFTADAASGITLESSAIGGLSPRLFFHNTVVSGSAVSLYLSANNTLNFNTDATPGTVTGTTRMKMSTTALFPETDNAFASGAGSNRWSFVHATTFRAGDGSGANPAYAYGTEPGLGWYRRSAAVMGLGGGDLLPETDSNFDLGSTTIRWANVWTDLINGLVPGVPSFPLRAPDGLVGAPSYSFTNDIDSGMTMSGGAGTLELVVASAARVSITANSLAMAVRIDLLDGSGASPSLTFASEVGLGLYRVSTGVLGVAGGHLFPETDSNFDLGSTAIRWANLWVDNINGSPPGGGVSFPLLAPNGTLLAPSYSWSGDTDSGLFAISSGIWAASTNNSEALRFSSAVEGTASGVRVGGSTMKLQQDLGRFGAGALRVQATGANEDVTFTLMPSGTNSVSLIRLYNDSDPANTGAFNIRLGAGTVTLFGEVFGTGTDVTLIEIQETTYINSQLRVTAGSVGAPSIAANADTTSGLFFNATDNLACAHDGVEIWQTNNQGFFPGADGTMELGLVGLAWQTLFTDKVRAGDGSSSIPSLSFESETGLGIYRVSANLLGIAGNVQVDDAGPHVFGSTPSANSSFKISGSFSNSGDTFGLTVDGTYNPGLAANAFGAFIAPTLVEFSSGAHPNFTSLYVAAPTITAGAASITNATTLLVAAAPSAGVNNRAFWVVGGLSEFGDRLTIGGAGSEKLRLQASSATGSPFLTFFQSTTRRAFIEYSDTGPSFNIRAEESGATLALSSSGGSITMAPSSTVRLTVTDTLLKTAVPIRAENGVASAPPYSFTNDIDTGMYLDTTAVLAWSIASVPRMKLAAALLTVFGSIKPDITDTRDLGDSTVRWNRLTTDHVRTDVGAALTPPYSFVDDTNTGMFRGGADTLNFATAGVDRMNLTATRMRVLQPIHLSAGSVGAPIIAAVADTTSGLFFSSTDNLAASHDGVKIWETNNNGFLPGSDGGPDLGQVGLAWGVLYVNATRAGNGSVGIPSHSFESDTDTGMWLNIASILSFSAAGSERLRVTPTVQSVVGPFTIGSITLGIGNLTSGDILANNGVFCTSDSGSGNIDHLYHDDTQNEWRFVSDGTRKAVGSSRLQIGAGTVARPAINFGGDDNTGIFRIGLDLLGFAAGGVEHMRLDNISATEGRAFFDNGQVYANEFAVAAAAINWDLGNVATISNVGIRTITHSNFQDGASYVLRILAGASAVGSWNWPSGIQWLSGDTAPVLTTISGNADLVFITVIAGVPYGSYTLNHT